jgi:glycosyltransferase involved in cell wall biosynthesis
VLARRWLERVPSVVSLDATPLQYDELGAQYGHTSANRHVEHLKWRANRVCFERAVHVVAWSEWSRAGLIEGYGTDGAKITVIPPGVTPSLWARPQHGTSDFGPVRILFVGGDFQRKGGDVLLRAFRDLRAELSERHGNADMVQLDLVTAAKVPETPGVTVHNGLAPNSEDLIALYHGADIFCLPTSGDCLPMVLSEAGAAGLPLVSTSVAGIPEIVKDGETGLIVPAGDHGALTRALARLVCQPELRCRLGEGARQLVARDFDADKNAARLVDLLVHVATNGTHLASR